jgi:hypothetical protein
VHCKIELDLGSEMCLRSSVAQMQHHMYELYDSYNIGASDMPKGMVKVKAKGKTPDAVKAKGPSEEVLDTALVPMPKSTGLSLDTGIVALRYIAAAQADEDQISQLRKGLEPTRGKAQVLFAMAALKMAINDKTVDLTVSLKSDKTHKREKNILGKQFRLATGLMHKVGDKIVLTDEANAILNVQPGDDSVIAKRKKSIRANFSSQLTRAYRVALHAMESGATMSMDASGFLRLTDGRKGNAIKQQFGIASVVLNEDQNQKILDKKGKPINHEPLKVKPSFTEIGRKVGEVHGVKIVPRAESRTKTVDPIAHLIEVCGNLVKSIEKLPSEIPENARKALESLQNAISKAIE